MSAKEAKKRPKILEDLARIAPIIPSPIYWEDTESRVLGVNEETTRGIGTTQEILGKTPYDFYPHEVAKHIVEHNEAVMRAGKILTQEEPITDVTTGEVKYFTAIKGPLRDEDGTIIGIIGTSIDITERKMAEEQLKIEKEKAESALKAKSDFLAVVSHELRTPLTGILGMVEILQSQGFSAEKTKEYLNNISNASKHLLTIINNILDFTKLNESKFSFVRVPFELKDVFEKTSSILGAKAFEKNIYLKIDFPDNLSASFLGDPKVLMQIFINIIGNAIKFTEHGGVFVSVGEAKRSEKFCTIRVEVKDTGIGIPADKLGAVFERFEQVHSIGVRAYEGTGLGLSVTKKLVEQMKGQVFVESKEGGGSTFTVEIPLELDLRPKEQRMAAEPIEEVKLFDRKIRVLLVEDDPLIQLVHSHKLERLGCQVDLAVNGNAGLALFSEHEGEYDIAFIDIGLPDITGNELIEKIRSAEKEDGSLYIVALTAYSDEQNRSRAKRSGANIVLTKPIEDEKLKRVLSKIVLS